MYSRYFNSNAAANPSDFQSNLLLPFPRPSRVNPRNPRLKNCCRFPLSHPPLLRYYKNVISGFNNFPSVRNVKMGRGRN